MKYSFIYITYYEKGPEKVLEYTRSNKQKTEINSRNLRNTKWISTEIEKRNPKQMNCTLEENRNSKSTDHIANL